MLRKKNRVTVQLVGGIGNQLFQYFAGRCVASRTSSELILDTSRIGVGGRNHGSTIADLNISQGLSYSRIRNYFYRSLIGRTHDHLLRSISFYRIISRRFSNHYQSSTLGYDEFISQLSAPVTLSGYFQTSQYYDSMLRSGMQKIELCHPSSWYYSMLKVIQEKQSLAIHFRRGDYVQLKETFGLLSNQYYFEAVKAIRAEYKFTDVFIFSDDLSHAKEMNLTYTNAMIHYVTPPPESSAAESLMLMSAAGGLILSNSTFAWWSAVLGKIDHVTCPKTWFRNSSIPNGIVQQNWITIDSYWED